MDTLKTVHIGKVLLTMYKIVSFSRAVVVNACNPSTQEAERGGSEFKASLVYRVSFRTGSKVTQRNLVLKKTS